jgi:hypothetical protein
MAFEDTWEWNMDAERAYEEIERSGGLSRHDGPKANRTTWRVEGNGFDLSALRSHGQPLFENADGRDFRAAVLQERDHLAENLRSRQRDSEIRSSARCFDFLSKDRRL